MQTLYYDYQWVNELETSGGCRCGVDDLRLVVFLIIPSILLVKFDREILHYRQNIFMLIPCHSIGVTTVCVLQLCYTTK